MPAQGRHRPAPGHPAQPGAVGWLLGVPVRHDPGDEARQQRDGGDDCLTGVQQPPPAQRVGRDRRHRRRPERHRRHRSQVGDREDDPRAAGQPRMPRDEHQRRGDDGAPGQRVDHDGRELEHPHRWTADGQRQHRQPGRDGQRAAEQGGGGHEERSDRGLRRPPAVQRQRQQPEGDDEHQVARAARRQGPDVRRPDGARADFARAQGVADRVAVRRARRPAQPLGEHLAVDGGHLVPGKQLRRRACAVRDVHDHPARARVPSRLQDKGGVGGAVEPRRHGDHAEGDDEERHDRWRAAGEPSPVPQPG